jgi:hypothetical protein
MSSERVSLCYISLDVSRMSTSLCLFIALSEYGIVSWSSSLYTGIVSHSKSTGVYSALKMHNVLSKDVMSSEVVYLFGCNQNMDFFVPFDR